jgi:hypothetical protein
MVIHSYLSKRIRTSNILNKTKINLYNNIISYIIIIGNIRKINIHKPMKIEFMKIRDVTEVKIKIQCTDWTCQVGYCAIFLLN